MKSLRAFVLTFFLYSSLYAQFEGYTPELPVQMTEKYRNSNSYQQDFLYLAEGLTAFHADVFMNFPEKDFLAQREIIYNRLSECKSDPEFRNVVQGFLRNIKDAHTRFGQDISYNGNTYPFRCKYLRDSLCILSVTSQLPADIMGEIIVSLNDISISEIEKRSSGLFTHENRIGLQNEIMLGINNTSLLKETGVIKDDNDSVIIKTASGKAYKAYPNSTNQWLATFPKHPVTERQFVPFTYSIVKEKELCYIQFNNFMDKRTASMYADLMPWYVRWMKKIRSFFGSDQGIPKENMEDFMNRCLEDAEKNNVKKILLDIRYNTGGSYRIADAMLYALGVDQYKSFSSDVRYSELYRVQMNRAGRDTTVYKNNDSTEILCHTIKGPGADRITRRFKGKVYLAISEWTFSSAVFMATVVKDNGLFKVMGEPVKERPSHFGDVLFLKLPNSGAVCPLSSKLFHRPDKSRDNEDSLYPDVLLPKTYRTIIEGIDPVYEFVINETI